MVGNPSILNRITVLGRGDSAGSWNNGAQPFTGAEIWGIQISSVSGDGSLNVLDTETATGFAAPANIADYLTFTLDNPVSLSPGVAYAWSINLQTTTAWFGFARSTGDVYADGYAFNNNSSLNNQDDNTGGSRYSFQVNGFAAPNPNNYDYVFAAVGTVVPEPSFFALAGLASLGLMARLRRGRLRQWLETVGISETSGLSSPGVLIHGAVEPELVWANHLGIARAPSFLFRFGAPAASVRDDGCASSQISL